MRISDWSSDVCSSDLEDGEVDPGVIGPVPGCPDDCVDLQLAPVFEARRPSLSIDNAGFQVYAVPSPELPWARADQRVRSEEHTSEIQSLMRISYAVFCLNKKNTNNVQ